MLNENKPKTEETAKQKEKQEHKHLGRIRQHPGHTLFEINTKEGSIRRAKFIDKKIFKLGTGSTANKSVQINKDCVYISALNVKNALRKFKKGQSGFKSSVSAETLKEMEKAQNKREQNQKF